jgi:uncharacterized protein (TIGR04255 family)
MWGTSSIICTIFDAQGSEAFSLNAEVYAHAPITEAALDIRVRGAVDKGPDDLLAAADPNYPLLFQRPVKMEVKIEGDANTLAASATASNTLLGFAYKSTDEKQVYQFRTDGFTHNRLAPYKEWDFFVAEARRLWQVYKNAVKPQTVELLGLNYINEISIPIGVELSEYVKTYIEVPNGLPQTLNTFTFGYQVTIPGDEGFLYISQGYGVPRKEGFANLVLNIQAFKQVDLPTGDLASEQQMWLTFEALRKAKSSAFEACITDKVREMIR